MKNKLARLLGLLALSSLLNSTSASGLPIIRMDVIAQIESSGNPKAYNKRSKATGLYQITPICLLDFNVTNGKDYSLKDMYDEDTAFEVASWYIGKRIPQMLNALEIPITVERILWAYNAGIFQVSRDIMPNETRQYINKYHKLAKEMPL